MVKQVHHSPWCTRNKGVTSLALVTIHAASRHNDMGGTQTTAVSRVSTRVQRETFCCPRRHNTHRPWKKRRKSKTDGNQTLTLLRGSVSNIAIVTECDGGHFLRSSSCTRTHVHIRAAPLRRTPSTSRHYGQHVQPRHDRRRPHCRGQPRHRGHGRQRRQPDRQRVRHQRSHSPVS